MWQERGKNIFSWASTENQQQGYLAQSFPLPPSDTYKVVFLALGLALVFVVAQRKALKHAFWGKPYDVATVFNPQPSLSSSSEPAIPSILSLSTPLLS